MPASKDNTHRVSKTGPVSVVSGNTTFDRGMTTKRNMVMWCGGVTHRTVDRPTMATAVGHMSCVGVWDVRATVNGGQSDPGESLGCAALM